jgi:hypothetical protein
VTVRNGFTFTRIILSRPDDGSDGELHRWRFKTPWFSIMLHRHVGPDPGRALHDHPWTFWSLILRGGYTEERSWVMKSFFERKRLCGPAHTRTWRAGSLHKVGLYDAHRITRLSRVPTWTLIFTGPIKQKWGFYPNGQFVRHESYDPNIEAA